MTTTIVVPKEYGYTLVTATASFFLAFWHGTRVSPFRKAAKIPYPNAYASQEAIAAATTSEQKQALYLFNCSQRAHYNFLENYSQYLASLLISGLAFPRASAALGTAWLVFRVVYATGYTRSDKENGKGRLAGSAFWLCQLGLFSLVGKMGYDLITS